MASEAAGRVARWELLAAMVETCTHMTSGGDGATLVMEGEHGIGKTTLLKAIGRELENHGVDVSQVACDPLEAGRPFAPWRSLLASWLDGRDQLSFWSRLDAPGAPESAPFTVIDDLVAVVSQRASERGVLIVIDDFQWADEQSVRAMAALCRVSVHEQIGIVLARTHRADQELDRTARRLAVPALTEAEVACLVEDVTSRPPGPRLQAVLAKASGNPFFVLELVRLLGESGALATDSDMTEMEGDDRSVTAQDAVAQRLRGTPTATVDLLRIASVAGRRFDPSVLAHMAKIDAVTVFERMGPAMQSGLIVERGAALCFTHDVVRDALYESSPESFRRVLHLEAGKALLDAGGDMDVVAAHLVQASVTNDPRLVGVLRKAALRSGVRSTLTSVTLLRRAVDSSPPDDPRRDHLIGELVTALVSTGACEEARRRALAVLDRRPNSQTEALVRGALVVAALDAGDVLLAAQETERVAGLGRGPLTAFSLAAAARYYLIAGQQARARALIAQAATASEREYDPLAACQLAEAASDLALAEGRLRDAADHARRAAHIAESLDHFFSTWVRPDVQLAIALTANDDLVAAASLARRAAAEAEAIGLARWAARAHDVAALVGIVGGDWEGAQAELDVAATIGDDTGSAVSGEHVAMRFFIAAASGDVAREPGETGTSRFNSHPLAVLASDPSLETLWSYSERHRDSRHWIWHRFMEPELVRLLLSAGRRDDARDVAEHAAATARLGQGAVTATAAGAWCVGLVEGDADAVVRAARSIEDHAPYLAARALDAAADALVADQRVAEAIAALRQAWSLLTRLTADAAAGSVAGRLRMLGGRVPSTGGRARSRTGWDSLTPAEMRVVGLVARGMTNKEIAEALFVSRRTVATHLERIFPKLGLRSRVDLAREATTRGYESVV